MLNDIGYLIDQINDLRLKTALEPYTLKLKNLNKIEKYLDPDQIVMYSGRFLGMRVVADETIYSEAEIYDIDGCYVGTLRL